MKIIKMNKKIGIIGAAINALTVLLFAIFLIANLPFAYFFVCILLSLSYVMMISIFDTECKPEYKGASKAGLLFGAVYCVLIIIVYFTQCTTVHNETLSEDIAKVLDYKYFGLMFNLDMLGYGIMALSTFFIGLTINVKNKKDKALKILLLVHGLFFFSCLIVPMLGIFKYNPSSTSNGGVIALVIWCIYFLPIGILSIFHFLNKEEVNKIERDDE